MIEDIFENFAPGLQESLTEDNDELYKRLHDFMHLKVSISFSNLQKRWRLRERRKSNGGYIYDHVLADNGVEWIVPSEFTPRSSVLIKRSFNPSIVLAVNASENFVIRGKTIKGIGVIKGTPDRGVNYWSNPPRGIFNNPYALTEGIRIVGELPVK